MDKLFILLFILVFSLPGVATEEYFLKCKLGKIIRTVRIAKTDSGCETTYTKAGVDRIVGSGQWWSSCLDIANNIKTNLEGASWKCKEFPGVEVIKISSGENSEASE